MNKESIAIMSDSEIVDKLISSQSEDAALKKDIDMLKAELQSRGLKELEDHNTKFTEIYGAGGIANVTYAQKLEILSYFRLQELLGVEFIEEKIKRIQDIKYDVDKKFNQALIALATGDYFTGYNLQEVIDTITTDDKSKKLLFKKLKGDYKADRKTLSSVLAIPEAELNLDTELGLIYKIKNWELIRGYFNEDKLNSVIEELRKCIAVDETVKIGIKSNKDDDAA